MGNDMEPWKERAERVLALLDDIDMLVTAERSVRVAAEALLRYGDAREAADGNAVQASFRRALAEYAAAERRGYERGVREAFAEAQGATVRREEV